MEAAVAASSKEAVTGNVLIWFLCAVAFLKVSQKIDSFMATLWVNVGRTGGSMLAEAMIAARGVTLSSQHSGCKDVEIFLSSLFHTISSRLLRTMW